MTKRHIQSVFKELYELEIQHQKIKDEANSLKRLRMKNSDAELRQLRSTHMFEIKKLQTEFETKTKQTTDPQIHAKLEVDLNEKQIELTRGYKAEKKEAKSMLRQLLNLVDDQYGDSLRKKGVEKLIVKGELEFSCYRWRQAFLDYAVSEYQNTQKTLPSNPSDNDAVKLRCIEKIIRNYQYSAHKESIRYGVKTEHPNKHLFFSTENQGDTTQGITELENEATAATAPVSKPLI